MYNEKLDYEVNGKKIQIPLAEIKVLQHNLQLTVDEAIQTWLDDNDYTTNEVVEELTKKAKDNKTTLINKARENVGNKKTTRERKENPTKALIIAEIFNKLTEIEGISQLKVENKEKLVTFSLNGNEYKIDLIQKRKEQKSNKIIKS